MTLRLYVDGPLLPGGEFALSAGAARHAQVRRVQPGDALRLFDGSGGEWAAEVTLMTRSAVWARLLHFVDVEVELAIKVRDAFGTAGMFHARARSPEGERLCFASDVDRLLVLPDRQHQVGKQPLGNWLPIL